MGFAIEPNCNWLLRDYIIFSFKKNRNFTIRPRFNWLQRMCSYVTHDRREPAWENIIASYGYLVLLDSANVLLLYQAWLNLLECIWWFLNKVTKCWHFCDIFYCRLLTLAAWKGLRYSTQNASSETMIRPLINNDGW